MGKIQGHTTFLNKLKSIDKFIMRTNNKYVKLNLQGHFFVLFFTLKVLQIKKFNPILFPIRLDAFSFHSKR